MKYTIITKIGRGTYGNVYAARLPSVPSGCEKAIDVKPSPEGTGSEGTAIKDENLSVKIQRILQPYREAGVEIFALKKMFNSSSGDIRNSTLIEFSCLNLLASHPNIAKVKSIIFNNDEAFLVMNYYPKTLRDIFRLEYDERIELFPSIAHQICSLLAIIHSQQLCHRDMKPTNILLSDDNDVFIADWGLAKVLDETYEDEEEVNTLWYRPPELFTKKMKKYGASQVDMWGLGVALLDMVNGYFVFEKANGTKDMKRMLSQHDHPSEMLPALLDEIPKDIIYFIDRCTEKDPLKRITAAEALKYLEKTFGSCTQGVALVQPISQLTSSVAQAQHKRIKFPSLFQGPLDKVDSINLNMLQSNYRTILAHQSLAFIHNIFCHITLSNAVDEYIEKLMNRNPKKTYLQTYEIFLHSIAYFASIMSHDESIDIHNEYLVGMKKNQIVREIYELLGKNVLFGYSY